MGGAAGHLTHLYDNLDLTFGEIKKILSAAASGRLNNVTEKLDGLNLVFTWDVENRNLRAARSVGNIKSGGLDAESLAEKFLGRGNLSEAFNSAFKILRGAIGSLPVKVLNSIFGPSGTRWYSIEIIYTENPNIINYDSNNIIFHKSPVFEIDEVGKLSTSEDLSGADTLAQYVDRMQKAVAVNGWQIKGPAVLRMKKLHDGSILQTALRKIDEAASSAQVDDSADLNQYLESLLEEDIANLDLPKDTARLLLQRCLKKPGAPTIVAIKKNSDKSYHDTITEFLNNSPELIRGYILPIELAINDFAIELLKGLKSTLVDNSEAEVDRLRQEVSKAISKIESSGNDSAMEILKTQMEKLKDVSNISTPIEGVVFIWKGKAYKFVGSFAAANQILGLFKYGRGSVKPADLM